MKYIPVPETEEERAKKRASLRNSKRAAGVFTLIFGGIAALCCIGMLVLLLVAELRENTPQVQILLYSLIGGCAGGAVVFALLSLLFGKLSKEIDRTDLDFRERCDGEDSFFVGEGTLLTLEADALRIHAEDGGRADILVPYGETRFFSVCTRKKPKEKGEWSVVIEIPVRYLAKKGKYKAGDPPALVQTDSKPRLYESLTRHGVELAGALPQEHAERKKFERLKKFVFPDRRARKRALLFGGLGLVMIGVCVPVGIFWNVTAASLLGVFGLFILGRAGLAYAGGKSMLAFYREGIFWREKDRSENVFLKWEEVERITESEKQGYALLDIVCPYGAYHFPNPEGAAEFLSEHAPEKFRR